MAENGSYYQPFEVNSGLPSLANRNQVPGTGMSSYTAYPSLDVRQSLGKGGSAPTAGMPDPAMGGLDVNGGGGMPFWGGDSMIGNMGQGMNLIGSGVSLVGMLQNMKDARKNNDINRKNIGQQMSQSKVAFDRSVARQDGTSEAIRQRNERVAQMNQ
jgi:hypothetical protein